MNHCNKNISLADPNGSFDSKFGTKINFFSIFECFLSGAFSSARKSIRESELIKNGFGRVFGRLRCVRSRTSAKFKENCAFR